MYQPESSRSTTASASRSRKRNKKRKQRNRSRSMSSCRGPYNVVDSVLQRTPWYEAAEFSRFWGHYNALMLSTHLSVLQHAAAADVCPCEASPKPAKNKSRKRHNGHHGVHGLSHHSEGKWRPLSPTSRPSPPRLCSEHKLLLHRPSRRRSRARRRVGKGGPTCSERLNKGTHQTVNGDDNNHDGQESASELTSQMRGGMSLTDEQEPPVTEEFLAFLQQTIRHKEEWAKKKAAVQQRQAATAGSALITQHGDEIAPQKEHPDAVRSREMKALYGSAAPQLHAMETAVQLAFDRIASRHHARVWPNIPINIMFSDE